MQILQTGIIIKKIYISNDNDTDDDDNDNDNDDDIITK